MLRLLFLLLFVVFPFGELTKLAIGSEEIRVGFLDLAAAGLVGIWLIGKIGQIYRRKKIFWPVLTKPIFFFIGAAGFSLLVNAFRLNQKELIVSGLYLLRWMVYAGVYFVVCDFSSLRDPLKAGRGNLKLDCFTSLAMTRWGLIWAGVLAAIFGLLQYFLYPDLRNLSYLGWDPHKFRAFGTFLDSNFLGIILVLTIILVIDWQIRKCYSRIVKIFFIFICFLVLALTYSRSSYLAYFTGIGLISFFRKTPRLFWTALIIGLMTILMLPKIEGEGGKLGRQYTINARILNWQQSLKIIKDHPLFGVGFNSYRYAQKDDGFLKEKNSHAGAGADSSLLFVFATTGIIGIIAYFYLIYDILIYHIRKRDYIVVASFSAIIVHSFFNNTLFYASVMLWLWILVGSSEEIPRLRSG